MTEYVLDIMKKMEFPEDAVEALYNDILKIYSVAEAKKEFEWAIAEYEKDICCDHKLILGKADVAAELSGVHKYSAELLIYLCLTKRLREVYEERNMDLGLWYDAILDLKWKLFECKEVKGIWGSFVASWFGGFFKMKRFTLGRLQFEIVTVNFEYEKDGHSIKVGDKAINMHIPRTMTPLDKESCDKAYKQAAEFFRDEIEGDIAFVCDSWLLFPPFVELYSEKSNLYRFAHEFDVISVSYEEEGKYGFAWRLFDKAYTGNVDELPGDSSLRRAIKEHMKQGKRSGGAKGAFFYDLR